MKKILQYVVIVALFLIYITQAEKHCNSEAEIEEEVDILRTSEADYCNVQIEQLIKQKFKYPEEVEIERGFSIVAKAQNVEGNKYQNRGKVVGKNAYGVKEAYKWFVEFDMTSSGCEILTVEVY